MRVGKYELDVDVYAELEPYLYQFNRHQIRGEKLQSCSVFRTERTPSFAVNLVSGLWIDSGAPTEEMRKGNFIKLLAYLRQESIEACSEYLIEKYRHLLDDADDLTLSVSLPPLTQSVLSIPHDANESNYLAGRGITSTIQELFKTAEKDGAVALPHMNKNGSIINVKYRSTSTKQFWYTKNGEPIKHHVYGLYQARLCGARIVLLVESEIDALYAWSCGLPALAFSGASVSEKQLRLILNSNFNEICLATDNDPAGQRFKSVLIDELFLHTPLTELSFNTKDINELSRSELIKAFLNRSLVEKPLKIVKNG